MQLELDARRAELDKMTGLEKKISAENVELAQKTADLQQMLAQPGRLPTEDDIRREAESTKRKLAVEIQRWKKQAESQRQQIADLQQQYERQQSQLAQSEPARRVADLEQRLRQQSQAACSMHEWVQQKKRDSDYEQVQQKCLDLANSINQHLIVQIRGR